VIAPTDDLRDTRVLVTGVGGPAGLAVMRALPAHGAQVVAADADPSAAGLRLATERVRLPRYEDPAFADAVLATAQQLRCTAVVPTLAEELRVLTPRTRAFGDAGIGTWFPGMVALDLCLDKWRFARALDVAGVPTPATALDGIGSVPGPWIVKPRSGRGSRDVHAVDTPSDAAWACRHVTDPIVQHRCTGREFTVDALVEPGGDLVAAVPRWRLETKAGISTKGMTFADDAVVDAARRALAAVGLRGAANVQGFVGPDGAVRIVEINPRFSGGLPLSLAAGADLVGQYVRVAHGLPIERDRLAFTPGVAMVRYLESVFVRP
jgi:carbamoyl-phosphate synthase large subunit